MGVSRMTTLKVARKSVDIVDPYTREVRLWIRSDMSPDEIKSSMLAHLGMTPIREEDEGVLFDIKYGSKYSKIRIGYKPVSIEFIK